MLLNAFLQALREIRRNMMRSILTAIGIVIGIASVIAMVNIGQGAGLSITQSVSRLGSNTLHILQGQRYGPGEAHISVPFTLRDVEVLKTSIFTLEAISPIAGATLVVLYKDKNYQTSITGVDNDYFSVQNWALEEGSYFEKDEIRTGKNVCILGKTVVDNLFSSAESVLGEKVRIKNFTCEVIGILQEKGANAFGRDQDDVVVIPIKTFQRRIAGNKNVSMITASVKENFPLEQAKSQIRNVLRERRHLKANEDDNFRVRSMTSLLETLTEITSMLTMMLGAVAAISLIVGGIGIMNIMLVSVTERTREIGIRMAIGAMPKDILIQFIIEATVLSGIGGIIGVITGIGITLGVAKGLDIVLVVDPVITVTALIFSMLIGIIFGIIPARKAANMNPIDALRYE
jgi:putative ABC transport system permease protein